MTVRAVDLESLSNLAAGPREPGTPRGRALADRVVPGAQRAGAVIGALLVSVSLGLPGLAAADAEPAAADDAASGESDGKPGATDGAVSGVAAKESEPDAVDQARKHFKRGVELYADGDVGGSRVEFEHAYRLQPSFRLLYNLAQVSAELLDYVKAERYFVRYLEEGGDDIDPQRRIEVEAELERLRTRIGTVTVETNEQEAEVFIDDVSVGEAPLQALPVSAGQRRVRVEKTGFETETRMVNIIGGQAQTVRIELESTAPVQTTYSFAENTPTNTPAIWATVGTGVLALATAGAAFWAYRGEQNYNDELMGSTTRSDLDDLRDKTEQRALITDILLGVTVASAVVSTVLWVNGPAEEDSAEGGLEVGLGSLRATF